MPKFKFTYDVADTAKQCWGVVRAIEGARGAQKKSKGWKSGDHIHILGQLVHNRLTKDELEREGIITISDLKDARGGTVVITAHGRDPKEIKQIRKIAPRVIDMTCPIVKNLHKEALALKAEGRKMVLIGIHSRPHPEVEGIVGVLNGGVFIVECEEDVARIPYAPDAPIGVVAQTTFNKTEINRLTALIRLRFSDVKSSNTLCDDIERKQDELRLKAPAYDTVIVIGDPKSANSTHLADIARHELKKRTLFVLNASEVRAGDIRHAKRIFITAGASTPPSATQGILEKLHKLGGVSEKSAAQ